MRPVCLTGLLGGQQEMNYSTQGVIATGYLESQPGCPAVFRKRAVLGFARLRCVCHPVAEAPPCG